MNKTEYLLVKLAEECNEVAQRATKALTFGLDEIQEGQEFTNTERIVLEFSDVLTIMIELKRLGVIGEYINEDMILLKRKKLDKYMEYSRSQGCLDEDIKDFNKD